MLNLNLSCAKRMFVESIHRHRQSNMAVSLVFVTVKQDIQEFPDKNEVQRVIKFKEIKNVS